MAANEFPDLAQRYMVMAVPKTVVNDRVSFEGALPEAQFVDAVLRAVGAPGADGARGPHRDPGGRRREGHPTRALDPISVREGPLTWEQLLLAVVLGAVLVLLWRRGLG